MIAKLFDILGMIVGVAATTVIVTGKNSAPVITAFGNAFSGSLASAMGR